MTQTLVHRPTAVRAARWEGDPARVSELLTADDEIQVDGRTLWVTARQRGRLEVFPVFLGDWVVRRPDGTLHGMSQRDVAADYDIVAA